MTSFHHIMSGKTPSPLPITEFETHVFFKLLSGNFERLIVVDGVLIKSVSCWKIGHFLDQAVVHSSGIWCLGCILLGSFLRSFRISFRFCSTSPWSRIDGNWSTEMETDKSSGPEFFRNKLPHALVLWAC